MIGRTISHYTILSKLGEGGMGVVYLAEDKTLNRKVAIKMLPPHLLSDDTIRQRFEQEARTAAALNHSNICGIYSIGEHEGQQFIEMEYVDGVTMRTRMRKGPLELAEAISYAIQIGEALQEAHSKGVVHRDIKNDNIMIDTRGRIKVMDFGLAKLKGGSNLTHSERTVGTVAYMAPEQIQSGNVDARSDLFSLGVVLFEMLTGHRPFRGDYEAAMLYSILHEPPEPLLKFLPTAPSELLHVINTALEKNPEYRYVSAEEMVRDLRRVLRQSSPSNELAFPSTSEREIRPPRPSGRFSKKLLFILASVVGLALVIYAVIALLREGTALPAQAKHRQITFTGKALYPAISPDGKSIAYIARDSLYRIVIRDLTGGNPVTIDSSIKDKLDLRWSPQGDALLIVESGTAYTIPRLGGDHRHLEHVPFSPGPKAAWSPDGARIATVTLDSKRIRFVDRKSGDTSSVPVDGNYTFIYDIDWSHDGQWIAVLTRDVNIYSIRLISQDGTIMRTVVQTAKALSCPRWSGSGDAVLYLEDDGQSSNLMKVRVNPAEESAAGIPVTLQAGLQAGSFFSLSSDDTRLLYTRKSQASNLWRTEWDGNGAGMAVRTSQLTSSTADVNAPSVSPDGRTVVFSMGNSTSSNIYIIPAQGGEPRQLTFFDSFNTMPVWSPDGRYIAFASMEGGTRRVWTIDANGGVPTCQDMTTVSSDMEIHWSPSRKIFFQMPGNRNYRSLDLISKEMTPLVRNERVGWMFFLHISPDEKLAAVQWNRGPKRGLWMISLADSSQSLLVPDSACPIQWSEDGKWLYFIYFKTSREVIYDSRLYRIPAQGGRIERVVSLPMRGDIIDLCLNQKTNLLVCTIVDRRSDIWLMEHYDAERER